MSSISSTAPAPSRRFVTRAPWVPNRICAMGMDFAVAREAEVVEIFVDRAVQGAGVWVVTANLDHLRRSATEPEVRGLIAQADVIVADGMPIVVASRVAGMPLPERVAGSSMLRPLARRAAERGASMLMVGGDPGVADRAAGILRDEAPRLDIVGTHCPPFGFEDDEDELIAIERLLIETKPDIVLLALGFPRQDRLIERLRPLHPQASYMGVGIAFSFVAGDRRRAPAWMRRAGLEWAHRLLSEPGRLWRRYLVHGLPFALRMMVGACVARVQRMVGGPWFAHPDERTPRIGGPRS
jgi:N-acetylglucosaminyldiphosphoundecaprenol N-acetyl-beta-D-mannosaminyltransferase